MIYVCIPSHDEAETVGLVLWKTRKVFEALGREYHVLVADDGSTDHTQDVLDRYSNVVPLTVLRTTRRRGYPAAVEALLRRALELSDRPRRDCAIVMHADYTHRPEDLVDFVRRFDGGADVVVGEGRSAALPRGQRLARRFGAAWLSPAVRLPSVRDPTSGFLGFRLATLRTALGGAEPSLRCPGWACNAELLALAAPNARRAESSPTEERPELRARPSRVAPLAMARALFTARGAVRRARSRSPDPAPAPQREAAAPRRARRNRRGGRR